MAESHPFPPDASFDGGDLDCGNGLLLLIRKHIDPLGDGQLLEIRSTEISVEEDLPAWCRLTGNELVSLVRDGRRRSFLVAKGKLATRSARVAREAEAEAATSRTGAARRSTREPAPVTQPIREVRVLEPLPAPSPAPSVPALAVMGIGSWPRPRWLVRALHECLAGRLADDEFQEAADDAVRLAVRAQLDAGVDVLTDGEQRRDSYSSFVAARLDNCQLVPIVDLLPYVEDPEEFARELQALDVPADLVRHPAVFGPLGRSRPMAVHELDFVHTLATAPVKVALPGPYLLMRTMWMECIADRAYASREDLAVDIVRVLREEIACLLAAGAAIVQLDEPVLTEVVFGRARGQRVFMCGALGERLEPREELELAERLLSQAVRGFPRERLALHVCRGNWSRDESVALAGDYEPLLPLLSRVNVGTLFLELCTARAGDVSVLASLPRDRRIGVGVVDQKSDAIESPAAIAARAERAIALFGAERVLLNPDCGFATFADNPIASLEVAEAKLAAIAAAARLVRGA